MEMFPKVIVCSYVTQLKLFKGMLLSPLLILQWTETETVWFSKMFLFKWNSWNRNTNVFRTQNDALILLAERKCDFMLRSAWQIRLSSATSV